MLITLFRMIIFLLALMQMHCTLFAKDSPNKSASNPNQQPFDEHVSSDDFYFTAHSSAIYPNNSHN